MPMYEPWVVQHKQAVELGSDLHEGGRRHQ